MLLIAGDICPIDDHRILYQAEWLEAKFSPWLERMKERFGIIIGVGGNHDFVLEAMPGMVESLSWSYLRDSEIVFKGLKIWGSPMSPSFGPWAFMAEEEKLKEIWKIIPTDIDILMVHGPMYGIGDISKYYIDGRDPHVGSSTLREEIDSTDFNNLTLFVFGHIHEGYGMYNHNGITCINASFVNEDYIPGNKIHSFYLPSKAERTVT